ncbi:SDR family oxidoreductase [Schaedlerella arabinosiphila]|uniref:dTDP-4-dehydrorhamnose reductase n=1 Tax=Schaedlerella arabinosiphila TaxID=2044587 RepID=A0A3R8LFX6_9FIRM|nr:SDR family oxidoreductase [Schaedlerella arabinosiphila]RRK32489.1 SDR family oxidoreductase [Schaedlerella arabinosiphila]
MKFLILGCNGMAGHTISLYLKEQGYEVDGFAREESRFVRTLVGDVRELKTVRKVIEDGQYDAAVNCIGLLNKFAENNHEAAVFLNSYFPQFLAGITAHTSTQIIHISTDCVFSGSRGSYTESDLPDGELFYDRSKALGELVNKKDITFRNSIVGPDLKKDGIGLVNWFMQQRDRVKGYKNAMWTGQTTLQLAKTIENAAIQHVHGLYNMVPEKCISKYDMLILFNQYLRKEPIEITPEENFRIDKSLKRTNFERFSYKIPGYEEQVRELGEWMRKHREQYPHYEL